jgi:hypothetical protein
MAISKRYLLAFLATGSFIIAYYLYYVWNLVGLPSGRTFQGRLFGILGFVTILGALFCSARQYQGTDQQKEANEWQLLLGSVSVVFILAHASFHFGNVIATLAFVCLVAVVVSTSVLVVIGQRVDRLATQRDRREPALSTQRHYEGLLQRWLTLQVAFIAGLITFSLIHILSVLYY